MRQGVLQVCPGPGLRLAAAVLCLLLGGGVLRGQIEERAVTYDLTLDECLTQTLLHYPEIQRLRAEVERAAGTRIVYVSRALPQLSGQMQAGLRTGSLYNPDAIKSNTVTAVISTNGAEAFNPKPYAALSGEFYQPLIDVGIPPTLRRGRLEVILAQQGLNREVTDRLYEARTLFLRAQYFHDVIGLYEEIEKRLEANVDGEQRRLTAGTGGKEEVVEAKIQALGLQGYLTQLRGDSFSTLTRIAELIGRDPVEAGGNATRLRLPKPVGSLTYTPVSVDWRAENECALRERADLKLLRALGDAAGEDKRIAQAGYFPLVSLTSSGLFIPQSILLSRHSTTVVADQGTVSTQYRAGVQMSWTIIDNGQVTGTARSLEAARQAYEINLEQLEQNVPRELLRVKARLEDADAQLAALRKSVDSAEENLRLIEARVSLGAATQLDFLNAQKNLLSVRVGIVNAINLHEIARADLDYITGRYLRFYVNDAR